MKETNRKKNMLMLKIFLIKEKV